MAYCELGKIVKDGAVEYIRCSKTKSPCVFQRYCNDKKGVVHTTHKPFSYVDCKIKNEGVDILSSKDRKIFEDDGVYENTKKKKYKIISITPAYIIYEDGESNKFVKKTGDYKVGDYIEI